MRTLLDRAFTYLMLPIAGPQALWLRWRASGLPEAAGPRRGRLGNGPELRLMVLGDSSAAGVGSERQDRAVGGHLARRLSNAGFLVDWQIVATTGHTTRDVLRRLEGMASEPLDVVVICLGVNDAKNGVREWLWRRRMSGILDHLTDRFGAKLIVISGLPPLAQFPLLPWPLRYILGARTARFDRGLAGMADARNNCLHVPLDVVIEPDKMATDGFHAGPQMHAIWARILIRAMTPRLPLRGGQN